MSADEELGYVYLPFSTPSNDYYGGQRPGDGLFGESLVCLDARTGKRVWHFQIVHHGLWDYDLPAAPNLIDIRVERNSRSRPSRRSASRASATSSTASRASRSGRSRSGRCRSRRCPARRRRRRSRSRPGRRRSTGRASPRTTSIDFTPELRKEALAVLAKYNYGPLFTPPSLEKPTILMPGYRRRRQLVGRGVRSRDGHAVRPVDHDPVVGPLAKSRWHRTPTTSGVPGPMETLQGVPLWKPPYGRITAIDLNTGDHRWMVPMGDLAEQSRAAEARPAAARPLRARSHAADEDAADRRAGGHHAARRRRRRRRRRVRDPRPEARAYDKATGKVVGEVALPRNATAAPMTYMLNGEQFIVVPTGGANLPAELIALRLQ